MRSGMLLLTILSIAVLSSPTMAANYFKWTDENGVTHYSARKPVGHEAEVVRISAGGRSQQQTEPEEASKVATDAPAPTQPAQTVQKDEERCNWGRNTLSTLRNNHRIRMQDADGQLRYLTEEEKAEQLRLAQEAVEKEC